MDASFLSNLLAYSAQIVIVVAVGTLSVMALRIDAAPVRHTYWRVLLAICLALPWLQGRQHGGAAAPAETTVTLGTAASSAADGGMAETAVPWLPALTAIVAGGVVLRLMWVGVGLLHLRRLRRAGQPATPEHAHGDLQHAIGVRAEIRYVPGIRQPVTFGTLQPVVLLPDGLRGHARHIQRAVISHELFHVLRRDWLWTLSEEIVRAVFWFHPAIWWVISRVQLTREEAVDELVVLATGQRRTYLEALLAFADEAPLAPAAAFARRRHLYRRMMLISKEAVMSSRRVVITCAVLAVLVAAGSWYAVGAFPMLQAQEAQGLLNEPGPIEQRARPITPENPIPRRVYAAPAHYPQEAIGTGAEETVTLRITLNELGRVAEVRRMGTRAPGTSPALTEAFVKSAADAVRQWIFDAPADGPLAFNVTLRFAPEAEAILTAMGVGGAFSPPTGAIGGPDRGSAAGRTGRPGRTGGAGFGAAAPPPPPPPPSPDGFVRVGGAIRPPTKVKTVNPAYPLEAQEAKVQGVVILEAVIDPSGFVSDARVLRSIPLLDQAALDAVRQWEFTPTRLNGVPVSVIMTVTVAFTLT